jgi:hypothetical protein
MKGLQLAESYFNEYGMPIIRDKFPDYQERIAAGLIGDGSECLAFDDDISRDHDWGPGFCFWLAEKDYDEIGQAMQLEYDEMPGKYKEFERKTSDWGKGRVGVFEIGAFYKGFIGRPDAPKTLSDWLLIPDTYLSACTSGKVFYDPLGKFTGIQEDLLRFYPEDVRLVRIAAKCMSAAQSGQYNLSRCIRRGEFFAAQYAETKYCADIMSLVYLLNRKYTPYYKWIHRGISGLPILGDYVFKKIEGILGSNDHTEKQQLIEEISKAVIKELRTQDLSDLTSDFLLDHGPVIHDKITDEGLRKRNVWIG